MFFAPRPSASHPPASPRASREAANATRHHPTDEFSTVWKSWRNIYPVCAGFFHCVEQKRPVFPQCGKIISTVWKNPTPTAPIFPQCGKIFSTVWKNPTPTAPTFPQCGKIISTVWNDVARFFGSSWNFMVSSPKRPPVLHSASTSRGRPILAERRARQAGIISLPRNEQGITRSEGSNPDSP